MAMPASAPAGRLLKGRDPDLSRRTSRRSEADSGRLGGRTRLLAAPAQPRAPLADQRTRDGVNRSSDCQVSVPIRPSAGRPSAAWKERTAPWVSLPKKPVTGTSSPAPTSRCCAQTTMSPLLPRFSSGWSTSGR